MNIRQRLLLAMALFTALCSSYSQYVFPLKASTDKRYLVDQQDKPFPILGRTAWFIISQPEQGYKTFLDNTISHGYNSIEISAITHWPMGNHAPFNGQKEIPFVKRLNGKAWDGGLNFADIKTEGPDFNSPNEKYWQYLDAFLTYCASKNIMVFMFPGYLGFDGKEQGWMRELVANGPAKTEIYGAWVAKRYAGYKNIVWMLLGDMGKFNPEQKEAEAALIKGLKSVKDQQAVLYSAESYSGQNAADNAEFGYAMTLNGSYTWDMKVPVAFVARKAYAHEPVMPAFLLEEPYDEEGPDGNNYNPNATQPVRRFQWWGWLSTTGGYIAGNGYIWQFVDPIWQQHLNTLATLDMGRLNTFIQSIDWWKLVPSGLNGMKTLIIDSSNRETDTLGRYVAAAAAKDGSLLLAYIPPAHQGSIIVDLSVLKGSIHARWFDPTDGRYTVIPGAPLTNTGVHRFTPPGKNSRGETDWVLKLSTGGK